MHDESALTHDTKIIKKRTHEETIEEGKRKKSRNILFILGLILVIIGTTGMEIIIAI